MAGRARYIGGNFQRATAGPLKTYRNQGLTVWYNRYILILQRLRTPIPTHLGTPAIIDSLIGYAENCPPSPADSDAKQTAGWNPRDATGLGRLMFPARRLKWRKSITNRGFENRRGWFCSGEKVGGMTRAPSPCAPTNYGWRENGLEILDRTKSHTGGGDSQC